MILKQAAKRARREKHINPHLFRHAFGCHMTAAGVSLKALQQIMGNPSPIITEQYSQVMAEILQREMEKL